MANPNIVNVTSIIGKTDGASGLSTSLSDVLTNVAGSSKLYKVNTVSASNTSSSLTGSVDLAYADSASTYYFIKNIDVPPDATLLVLDKNSQIYLEENTKIRAKSGTAGIIDLVISYEVIS